jgi:hypothetical protein
LSKPTYRDNRKFKHCIHPKERLPQLAFCEALKLDAYVHVGKVTVDLVKKYQHIISNSQALVYSLFGAIGYSCNIPKDLAKNGDIGELQTGTAKNYIHNQSNEYPNGCEFGCCSSLEEYTVYKKHSFLLLEAWNVF